MNRPKTRKRGRGHASRPVWMCLAIDSNFEPVTRRGFKYRQANLYPYLRSRNVKLVLCQGPMARRADVQPQASKTQVRYVTGVGHGTPNSYTGDKYAPIFTVGRYGPAEARGKIVHLLSCWTALQLGPDFVAKGCRAFFGYDEAFTFVNKHADVFFECDTEIDRAFAEGLTAAQVYRRTMRLFDRRIEELHAQRRHYTAVWLAFNRKHLCGPSSGPNLGNPRMRIP